MDHHRVEDLPESTVPQNPIWLSSYGCVWKWLVPLNPMVLLIIIPMKNGYFIANINPTFSDKPIFPIETAKCWGFPIFSGGTEPPLFNMCIPELSVTIHWNPSNMLINYIILYNNSLHPHYISIVSLRWLVLSSLLVDSPLNHHEHIWFVCMYTHYLTITSPIIEIVNWLHWIITRNWFVAIRSPLYRGW